MQLPAFVPLPFLDLPFDARKETYDCYAGVISISDNDDEERKAVSKTRKSLLSVCRQVNAEWTPTFIRTTNIIVHGPRSAYIAHTDPNVLTGRSLVFDKAFLRSVSAGLTNNIRRLCYDASIHGPQGYVNHRLVSTVNFQALRQLAHILSRSSSELTLLQDVELYARWQAWTGPNRDIMLRRSLMQPCEKEIWAFASEHGQWEQIEDQLARRNRRAALKGWEICRNVKIATRWDKFLAYECRRIFSVHVHFSKQGTDAGSANATDPKTTVDFLPPAELVRVFINEYKD
ncbi:hypothetical protein H2200_011394 [Cladophialophora chaetospira]|uniref:Uncharacterized protein n=1 Tax=Cladophialophora chaetospira TaxID=386627 RepID=A0AA38WZB9_9EURO|nr:hypothetical protein H2200_011394 [Cladophialophora chaetospira]